MVVTAHLTVKTSGTLQLPSSISQTDIKDMLALISDKITVHSITKKGKHWLVRFSIITNEEAKLPVLNDILDNIEAYHMSIKWHIDDVYK